MKKSENSKLTPIMKQFYDIKEKYPNEILLFRMGDFYEMFGEDAEIAAPILNLTLTSRAHGKSMPKTPLAGVPYHSVDRYIKQLIDKGRNVAICEQLEDPSKAKGIVKRGVVEVITPGTVLPDDFLDNSSNNFLTVIVPGDKKWGVSLVDISTGEFEASTVDENLFVSYLQSIRPAEVVFPDSMEMEDEERIKKYVKSVFTPFSAWRFNEGESYQKIKNFFHVSNLKGFGLESHSLSIQSAGAALAYLEEKHQPTSHIKKISSKSLNDYMVLDSTTIRNLELLDPINPREEDTSLISIVDETETPMGSRLLRKWITRPLLDVDSILSRQKVVRFFYHEEMKTARIRKELKKIGDMERLISRIHSRRGNARDLVRLRNLLKELPKIKEILPMDTNSSILESINKGLYMDGDLIDLLDRSLTEEPPISIREGGMIKKGYHAQLDELKEVRINSKRIIAEMEKKETLDTGINNLRIKYNRVHGYFIEVTKSHKDKVPERFIRKQTMVNAERYVTPELKELEEKVLTAEEKIFSLEERLFEEVKSKVLEKAEMLQFVSGSLALIDIFTALAFLAKKNYYCKPELSRCDEIVIKNGRHPVVEKIAAESQYVPNDLDINTKDKQIIIITGPNMAGKSTYLRMVAIITLMTQVGSFVPAESARIGIVDRIFTRVGASDNLAKGESTFLVEMNETANILNNASPRSLVILDEVGRGTSTFDGLSIAWALVEYLHDHERVKAKTLFATHYHELTELELLLRGVENYQIIVKKIDDKIVFLRKIEKGSADQSYGIDVAALAGMPKSLLERAKEVLSRLEEEESKSVGKRIEKKHVPVRQLTLFKTPEEEMAEKLKRIDLNKITPLKALEILTQLKNSIH